jgi:DNA-binding response OmpR family regulator
MPTRTGGGRLKIWALFCLLARRRLISRDAVMIALYDHENDRPTSKVIDAYICRLRQWLCPHGIELKTNRGEGWYFTPDMQKRAQALIAKLMEEG